MPFSPNFVPCQHPLYLGSPTDILEEPEILKFDGDTFVLFSVDQYSIILQMYTAYQLYIDTQYNIKKLKIDYNKNISIYEQKLEIKDKQIKILKDDREHVYNLLKSSNKECIDNIRRQKIKTFFIASGSGLAGIGIGALIFLIVH